MNKTLYMLVFLFSLFMLNNEILAWSEYKIGREVEYNGMEFYVIKDSSSEEDSVTMLKAEPLTYEEVQNYSTGVISTINNNNGYGTMIYHISSSAYSTSNAKITIDAWAAAELNIEDLAPDLTGYNVRLLTHKELITNLGYMNTTDTTKNAPSSNGITPDWVYNSNYWYWTMSQFEDMPSAVWIVENSGRIYYHDVHYYFGRGYSGVIRPVITIYKSALGDIDDSENDQSDIDNQSDIDGQSKDDDKQIIPDKKEDIKKTSTKVKVDNTYLSQSIIIIILGFVCGCVGVIMLYQVKSEKKR